MPGALANQYLGLFNDTSNGQSTNNVLAVEIDTVYNIEFDTVQGPHVGIDVNSLKSVDSTVPAYFVNGESKQINVNSGDPVQVWVEYDGIDKKLAVTLAPLNTMKPDTPLLSLSKDLSTIFADEMYVGFSASTQTVPTYHYVLGWSFQINGVANALNLSSLPTIPPQPSSSIHTKPNLALILPATLGYILALGLVSTSKVSGLSVYLITADSEQGFTYNGLKDAFVTRDGAARISETGLLRLTDLSDKYETGHVFYSRPLKLKGNVSFATTFVFAIASECGTNKLSGQGMAFVIAPQRALPGALANQYLGLFNDTSNGQSTNNVLAVEIDTVYNIEFDTVEGPHVGIDVNSLKSVNSTVPAYFVNGEHKQINVNSGGSGPSLDDMYIGFSASTQTVPTYHYVLGWSFQINGVANALNLSSLPTIPPQPSSSIHTKPNLALILPATLGYIFALVLLMF
ncbi:hypothetical protein C5167_046720 [Papaver somniferum]|uniref:Legume lectin domain-containing protein n=1 Tax=Papaver somniferum TaxID=3469 RepID=A0A4Y7LFD5_PAPSO|nr:hypothetical protein C5167_046720 [Papaver somniferum]